MQNAILGYLPSVLIAVAAVVGLKALWDAETTDTGRRITPTILVRHLRYARKLFFVPAIAIALFNAADFAAYTYFGAEFQKWLAMSTAATEMVAHYVWAPNFFLTVQNIRPPSRIAVLSNAISIDWLIYALGLVVVLPLTAIEFAAHRRDLGAAIQRRIAGLEKIRDIGTILGLYAVFSLIILALLYSGAVYRYAAPLYESDVLFMAVSVLFFYLALSFPTGFLILYMTYLCRPQ